MRPVGSCLAARLILLSSTALILVAAPSVRAAEAPITIRGKIVDGRGAPVAGAEVILAGGRRAEAPRAATAGPDGTFVFEPIPRAADYHLRASSRSFEPADVGPLLLATGSATIVSLTLRTREELRAGGVVEPDASGTVAGPLTGASDVDRIQRLPLIGRSYTDLLTLAPGVTDIDGDGVPNVQGARETGVQYRLDGADVTDPAGAGTTIGLDLDAIENVAMRPAPAGVDDGRFDGGLAAIRSRSGGDEFEGSIRAFWRGSLLDGDGTQAPSDTFSPGSPVQHPFHDLDTSFTAGGPILRKRLWYFTAIERIDDSSRDEVPGLSIPRTVNGWSRFAKISWRPAAGRDLAVEYADAPRDRTGLFLDYGVSPESDGTLHQRGRMLQARWTWIVSPQLLFDAQVSSLDSGVAVTPVSDLFHRERIATQVTSLNGRTFVQALYPLRECSSNGLASGFVPNCDPSLGTISISHVDLVSGFTSGPLAFRTDDSRTRTAFRVGARYEPQAGGGAHVLLGGFEGNVERFKDDPIDNPILFNEAVPCPSCRDQNGMPIPNAVTGSQVLAVASPSTPSIKVDGFSTGIWLNESWKIREGLVVQAGLRFDEQDLETSGFTSFDPRRERRRFFSIVDALCAEGIRIAMVGGSSNALAVCGNNRTSQGEPKSNLSFQFDPNTPFSLRQYDLNHDMRFDEGTDGSPWRAALTSFPQRVPETFGPTNRNVSPRTGVSWDPWAGNGLEAGKTKLFADWGRYYDRLFLSSLAYEQQPSFFDFTFRVDPSLHTFQPGQLSAATSTPGVTQIDRGLRTPRTDVLSLGAIRELSSVWSVGVTYVQRQAIDLLQDEDLNHITCRQFRSVYGIDPRTVCPAGLDPNGNVILGPDLFGSVSSGGPNGVIDLFAVNTNFNRVMRVGNFNGAKYRAATVEIVRRLFGGWQIQGSYTNSHATGEGETFTSLSLDDPVTRGAERAPLDWDQRHRIVIAATGTIPGAVELGTRVTWESGAPYSIEQAVLDQDNVGNVNQRTLFPTGRRNDQRNGAFWGIDARVAKRFPAGKAQIGVEAAVRNLLNLDENVLTAFRPSSAAGVQLAGGPGGMRRPGRAWQIGVGVFF